MVNQEVPLGLSFSGNSVNIFYSYVNLPGNVFLISRMDSFGGGTYWAYQFNTLCTTYLIENRLIGTQDIIIAASGAHIGYL